MSCMFGSFFQFLMQSHLDDVVFYKEIQNYHSIFRNSKLISIYEQQFVEMELLCCFHQKVALILYLKCVGL